MNIHTSSQKQTYGMLDGRLSRSPPPARDPEGMPSFHPVREQSAAMSDSLPRRSSPALRGPTHALMRSRFFQSRSSSITGRLNQTAARRIEFLLILAYSLVVMGSATPFFADISNVPVVLYYLFVPGYCLTRFFNEDYPIVQRLLFSALVSITLVLAVFSLRQTLLLGVHLPFDLAIPVFTLILLLFSYYHPRR